MWPASLMSSFILSNAVALGLVTETSDEEIAAEQLIVAVRALEARALKAETEVAEAVAKESFRLDAKLAEIRRQTLFSRSNAAPSYLSSRNQSPEEGTPMPDNPFKSSPAPMAQNCFTGNGPAVVRSQNEPDQGQSYAATGG